MSAAVLLAGLIVAALVLYGIFAGADFGGGVWDLAASGPRREAQRAAIARAIAPVWEANHVWMIFVIVLLFTGFPAAFQRLVVVLFVPFHVILVGIVLRGAAFVFRAYGPRDTAGARRWGVIFGGASVITPVLLGMALAAASSGALGSHATRAQRWYSPLAWTIGAFALAGCAYLAAVYLTLETDGDLREDFRRRAILAGTVVVALSVAALPMLRSEAPYLWSGLTRSRAVPLVVGGVVAALTSGLALRQRWYRVARVTSAAQVALLIAGWALAQYPYLAYPDLTLTDAAAPEATLRFVLYTVPVGAAMLGPSIWLLFRVFKRNADAGSIAEH